MVYYTCMKNKEVSSHMKIRLNPDKSVVEAIREGLIKKDGYCPCRLGKKPEYKCMCEEFRAQLADPDFEVFCHFMLFYKEKDS